MLMPLLPDSWVAESSALLPADPNVYHGPDLPFWFVIVALALVTVRSLIHLFKSDGGAHSIATLDISVEGGTTIVGLFGQWGAIQLLLAALLWALVLRYRGLLPLVLLVLLGEPLLRALAGRLKPIRTVGTAPGAKYNWRVVPLVLAMLYLALCRQ
jgi:hypothetical protein